VLKEIKLIETKVLALEETLVLGIEISVYNTILMNSVEKDLDEKLW
jgi:hypothetical protein